MYLSGTLAEKGIRAIGTKPSPRPRIWVLVIEETKAQVYCKTSQGMECLLQASAADRKNFAKRLSGWLDAVARENAFDRLVLAGNLQAIGGVRAALNHYVCARVVAEADINVTGLSEEEVKRCLDEIVWF